jgi:predicted DNA-binding protein (MmcQ/YjbR family)
VNDERALARLRAICLAFPEAEEAMLQDRPLFRVRSRRFALFNGASSPPRPRWKDFGRSLHFVTDPQERDALGQDGRFTASPHHGDRGWVAISLDGADVDWTELAELLETAYRHVAARALLELHDRRG